MTDNIERLPSHSLPGEKRGNTTWVSCRACQHWFHATATLIAMGSVDRTAPNATTNSRPRTRPGSCWLRGAPCVDSARPTFPNGRQ